MKAADAETAVERTLDVADLTVRFGGVLALDRVSLSIEPNQIHGIIGPNGAGKTTLFNAICGFVRPHSGAIRYRGRALIGTAPHNLARLGIARTLQGLGLWPGLTVLENVMLGSQARPAFISSLLGLPAGDRAERGLKEQAMAALSELGIGNVSDRLPSALPYGVQKRVIIARALMGQPSLLLLDEPASGLSPREIERLAELIGQLRSRMSVAVVEHHLDLIMRISQRITVLNFGHVIASGTPDEIRGNREVSSAYLGEEVKTVEGKSGA
jgi:branched-chain amino acid transport system ATP-binding protein